MTLSFSFVCLLVQMVKSSKLFTCKKVRRTFLYLVGLKGLEYITSYAIFYCMCIYFMYAIFIIYIPYSGGSPVEESSSQSVTRNYNSRATSINVNQVTFVFLRDRTGITFFLIT